MNIILIGIILGIIIGIVGYKYNLSNNQMILLNIPVSILVTIIYFLLYK